MAQSASSSLGVPGLNIRGIFFAIIVIALIAALFFIPEIIDYQRSSKVVAPPDTSAGMARASNSIFSGTDSPLAKIKNLISGGFTDRLRMKRIVERGDNMTGFTPKQSERAAVTWQDLRSRDSKKQLMQAQSDASEIAQTLPIDRTQSRYALVTLGNGLRDIVSGDADKTLAPAEAIRYIEYLHSNVTRSLVQENVDRTLLDRWQRIGFGQTVAMFSRQLDRQYIQFNPQLTLTSVDISQRRQHTRFEESAPAYVKANGYVVGSDIIRIEIWAAGTKMQSIKIGKPDSAGLSKFSLPPIESKGLVTFRVISKNDQKFEKVYQFFPRFRAFQYKNGKYLVPAAVSDADTSVDRFFTRGIRNQSGGSDNFFGGPLISQF